MARHRNEFARESTKPKKTLFGQFLDDKELTYAEAAEAIGRTRQYACMLAKQQRPISMDLAIRIAEWAKSRGGSVPVESWPNLAKTARALAKVNG